MTSSRQGGGPIWVTLGSLWVDFGCLSGDFMIIFFIIIHPTKLLSGGWGLGGVSGWRVVVFKIYYPGRRKDRLEIEIHVKGFQNINIEIAQQETTFHLHH